MSFNQNHAIFLHGWGTNHAVFNDFIPRLVGYHCIAIDLPGYGLLDLKTDFSPIDIADEILQTIDKPQHIFGWSLGGFIALLMAIRRPEKVRSLILCNTFARFSAADDYKEGLAINRWQDNVKLFSQNFSGSLKVFFNSQSLGNQDTAQTLNQLADEIISFRQPEHFVLQSSQQAVINADCRSQLSQITCPVLIFSGAKDKVTTLAMSEYLHRNIHNSEHKIWNKSAHMPFVSEASACASEVIRFWDKV